MPRLVDLLDRVGLKATLFVIARDAEAEAELWQNAARRGHEIASHSLTHPLPFSTLPADQMHRELVDGVGWTVPAKDVSALATVLAGVLDSPGEAAELGRRARQRVEAEYTWDQVARETEAFYYDVLERSS